MCRNYAAGGAAINAIGRAVQAQVVTVDIGVDADLTDAAGVVGRKVRRGTRDLSEGPAMTEEEMLRALAVGIALVREQQPSPDVVALGEMGIGNTTAASALTAVLTGASPEAVVGPGTGIDLPRLELKRRLVGRAVKRVHGCDDPLVVLAEVGGLEIAGLAGIVLGVAAAGCAVITDGFIATAAALVATRLCPACHDYLIASHCSPEPGHRIQLAALGLEPLLNLDLRLGEGTGAALAFPLLEAAGSILREMATFSSAGVSASLSGGT
jgi:nicotinate-nucleotide--dimethylbenzimidazole phosphoribosyltransferase